MSRSDEEWIEALKALPTRHRVAFAASTSERLFPNYEAFVAEEGCGDPAALREGLDVVWAALESGTFDDGRVRQLLARVEGVGPNSDDFSGMFTSLAANATTAAYYTLECCITGDPKSASVAAHVAEESIGFYLMGVAWMGYGPFLPEHGAYADPRAGTYMDQWSDASPVMLAELFAQEQDLATLRAAPLLTPEMLRAMRGKSQKAGIQPFERGLVKRENIPANPRPVPPPFPCNVCPDEGTCEVCGGTGRLRNMLSSAGTQD